MSSEVVELRAGPVRLLLDGADLRAVGSGPAAVVQRLYPAFRDEGWGTAAIEVKARRLERERRQFALELEGSAAAPQLELVWKARAQGTAEGVLTYALDVEARSELRSRRLGLCLHLDAAACAGARARCDLEGEEAGELTLTDTIAPQPLDGEAYLPILGPFTALSLAIPDGSQLDLETDGTPFELEDQRNWADSSLKAYSSGPPGLVRLARGEGIAQQLRLRLEPPNGPCHTRRAELVEVGPPISPTVVPIGLGLGGGWSPPADLHPAHLRLDAELGAAELPAEAAALAEHGGVPVELALHGSAGEEPRIGPALAALPLNRVLALERDERSTSAELVATVRELLGPGPPLGVGTSAHFSEVCRRPPAPFGAEFVCWSAHPQVHARDDRSVMENLPGLGAQVRTARALAPGLAPIVSELRLGPAGGEDPRGCEPFGAAWAIGAFAQLLGAGVHAVTVAGEPGREAVMTIVAELMSARGSPLRPLTGLDRDLAAVAWGDPHPVVLLANLRPTPRELAVAFPGRGRGGLRTRLDGYGWIRLTARR